MRAGRCGRWVGLVYPKGKTAGRRVLRRGVVWMIWRRETGRVPDEEARMGARVSVGKCCSPLVLGRAVGAWGGVRFPVVLGCRVRFPVVLGCRVRGCEEVLQGGGGRAGGRQGWWVLGASRVGQPRGWCSGRRGERAGPKGGLAGDGCLAGRYGGRGWGL